jgi:hypothetical protein
VANIIKNNPVGIDTHIQNLQISLYDNFKSEWNLTDDDWNCYGRIYKLLGANGKDYLPQRFISGTEYDDPVILFEDNVKLQSFFDISETQKVGEDAQVSCNVNLYFFVNLQSIFGLSFDRLDEKILSQVSSYINSFYGFNILSKKIGIKTVLKEYNGYGNTATQNMQPLFAFCLELEINSYYICYSNYLTSNFVQPQQPKIPFTRYDPTGIDGYIQRLQINLYNYLLGIFDGSRTNYKLISESDYNCFGRVYRNKRENEYFPQAFVKMAETGSMEYVNILFEDTCAIQSFFDCREYMKVDVDSLLTHFDASLYFFVDLSKLYTSESRMDEEFIILITTFLLESGFNFNLNTIYRGIKSIMNEYSGYKIKMNSKANMQNFLCFRLDMSSFYDDSFDLCLPLIPNPPREYQFNPDQFNPEQFK